MDSGRRPVTIYIVEDEALIVMELRDRLTDLGYVVVGDAPRGERALEEIPGRAPDLVLMDIHLAGTIDGIEAAAQLRLTTDIPVVFLSAYSDAEVLRAAGRTEPFGYLVKPFRERELHATLQMALYKVQMERQLRETNAQLEERIQERTAALTVSHRALESLMFSLAHDLRTPLRGIDGWSKVLIDDYGTRLDEAGLKYLANLRADAQRLGQVSDALLELAVIGGADLHRSLFDLATIARASVDVLQRAGRTQEVQVVIEPDLMVRGDAAFLRVVLDGLLDNAWKFARPHELLHVEVGQLEVEGVTVFFVRDNGSGFDMAFAAKLFTPFQRLHKLSELGSNGVGLGLARAQLIIQRHGGRIWAEAAVDHGATFFFTLP